MSEETETQYIDRCIENYNRMKEINPQEAVVWFRVTMEYYITKKLPRELVR